MPHFDQAGARRVLDEAGWTMGSDGVRVKDGQRATFLVYGLQTQAAQQYLQAMQADLRRVGIEMRIQMWDATVGWGRLATQEFDAFVMSYPYVTATDAMSLYFLSRNRPTPNRMNWNDEATDAGAARSADRGRPGGAGRGDRARSSASSPRPMSGSRWRANSCGWRRSARGPRACAPTASMVSGSTRASTSA